MSSGSRKRPRTSTTPNYEFEPELELDFLSDPEPKSNEEVATSHPSFPISQIPRGFLALPPELMYQVISYFPEIGAEHILAGSHRLGNWAGSSCNGLDLLVRFDVLRALSQLSRSMRLRFLPLLWERFQVCLPPQSNPKEKWFYYIGPALERKSKGLLESRHLWPYIKTVTVSLTGHHSSEAIPPFVKLLGVLPNVHTLEVLHRSHMQSCLQTYFDGNLFPSIQRLVLSNRVHYILQCCPGIKEVTCSGEGGKDVISTLVRIGCPKLETLRRTTVSPNIIKLLSEVKIPLKCISIDGRIREKLTEEAISSFSTIASLRTIEIEVGHKDNELDDIIAFASDALRKCAKLEETPMNYELGEGTRNAQRTSSSSTTSGPMLVRILRYLSSRSSTLHRTPQNYVPVMIKEYSVEVE
ncbi:hypothetical protein RSOLAG1IB_11394 [Rhizoctonia solani AG-1 IB]|uniref:Uncharacterized protein n=1 Tax=Thanatephorus cucumeris (strain AG1-IB / isolate 7/3/14) TaxID=1108050 RepID=A0A0B7FB63_THACB|nr:hypothetical protein RSOLAG1IB_11394 [Rhizoctonia solani AG-1 IB]